MIISREFTSPNFNDRKCAVSTVVIHYTGMKSGEEAIRRLCDPETELSAHYLIEEDGRIFQLVDGDKRAWHAGVSYWKGERDMNSASIGIELVNPGHEFGYRAFPEGQILSLINLLKFITIRFEIKDFVGHSDIAPGRKVDPGALFPWDRLAAEGFGIYPDPISPPSDFDSAAALKALGYNPDLPPEVLMEAFALRYPANTLGVLAALAQQKS